MILVVDLNEHSLGYLEFVKPILSVVRGAGLDYIVRKPGEVSEKDLASAGAAILSGTPLKDNSFLKEESIERLAWLKTFKQPVLGICAGMEVIQVIFGGKLKDSKEIGMTKIRTTRKNKLFEGEFEAYCLHRKAVSNGLNQNDGLKEFNILAESDNCIEAIRHKKKEKEIYGVMFHPEVRNQDLIKRFLEF
ncbi:gamma-glutamyl-gamma-aminobutyrate hydrolase family protein [Candidatus Woesearchaeota archaeon]|nr:gamma-glutamyl-gamma-aminobutyrate hydrolase family protein [Candidatus Woesearchaeota archaeon]